MSNLPNIRYGDNITGATQEKFGGIDHRISSSDGDIYDMMNLSSDKYPLITPRRPREVLRFSASELFSDDELYFISGSKMYRLEEDSGATTVLSGISSGEKQIVKIKTMICVFPDKLYYDTESGEVGSLEALLEGVSVTFSDGVLYEEDAERNALTVSNIDLSEYFSVGDAVEISGCTNHEENNVTPIIREISDDGHTLYFYEFTFTNGSESGVTLKRTIPELSFVFENENRLWGCYGNEVYCSKLGDPKNWRVYDGLASSSYQVSVGSSGSFTGACSFLGYPLFFKEEKIYRMYGNAPESYQLMSSATLGVAAGSHKSLAIAGETLFYVSRAGVVAYGGGVPTIISSLLSEKITGGVGGTDGLKYYLDAYGSDRGRAVYVYDTMTGVWHIEEALYASSFAFAKRKLYTAADGKLVLVSSDGDEVVISRCEFADWYDEYADTKILQRLRLRCEVAYGAKLTLYIRHDDGTGDEEVFTTDGCTKRSFDIPVKARRADHYRIMLRGEGDYTIYALTREYSRGSGARVR